MKNLKVVSLRSIGLQKTYCLEMARDPHNFVLANGLVSGNSHATAYGELGYRTAYYKYYAPAAFLAAKLNAENAKGTSTEDDIEILKKDAKSLGISITPCDINVSKMHYAIRDRKTIVTGFSAIKGLGEKALESLMAQQPYANFEDFLYRTPSSAVNKSVIIALAKAGAFDSFGIGRKYASEHYGEVRKEMLAFLKKGQKKAQKEADEAAGIDRKKWEQAGLDLPPEIEFTDITGFTYSAADQEKDDWSLRDKLIGEKEVLGEYVSGSVEVLYPGFFRGGIYAMPFARIQAMGEGQPYYLEGIVNSIKELTIKKAGKNQGKLMARLSVENLRGEVVDMTMWSDTYVKQKKALKVGIPMRAFCKVNEFNGAKSLILANLEELYKEKSA